MKVSRNHLAALSGSWRHPNLYGQRCPSERHGFFPNALVSSRTKWYHRQLFPNNISYLGSKEIPKDSEYEKAVVSSNVVYSMDTSTEPTTLHKMTELCGKIPKIDVLDSDKVMI